MIGYDDTEIGTLQIVVDGSVNSAVIRPAMTEFKKLAEINRLPTPLSETLANWTRNRPDYRVHTVFGIMEDGYTVAIHIWFDRLNH